MKLAALSLAIFLTLAISAQAEPYRYSLNLYGGELTANHWEDFFNPAENIDFQGAYLAAITLAKTIGRYHEKASFEIEGQIVKHVRIQHHWEFNGLASARWERFPWDRYLDTSVAFGLGPSWTTEKPPVEIGNEGETERFMVYWMLEFAFSLPGKIRWAVIARIHHRSEAFGLVADHGGSNALGLGLKYRF